MSEYTVYDFRESLERVCLQGARPVKVLKAWGKSGDYAEWEGGFLILLDNNRCAYLYGWCDTSGWGCQDDANVVFVNNVEELDIRALHTYFDPDTTAWDEDPADLNQWISNGMKGEEW